MTHMTVIEFSLFYWKRSKKADEVVLATARWRWRPILFSPEDSRDFALSPMSLVYISGVVQQQQQQQLDSSIEAIAINADLLFFSSDFCFFRFGEPGKRRR